MTEENIIDEPQHTPQREVANSELVALIKKHRPLYEKNGYHILKCTPKQEYEERMEMGRRNNSPLQYLWAANIAAFSSLGEDNFKDALDSAYTCAQRINHHGYDPRKLEVLVENAVDVLGLLPSLATQEKSPNKNEEQPTLRGPVQGIYTITDQHLSSAFGNGTPVLGKLSHQVPLHVYNSAREKLDSASISKDGYGEDIDNEDFALREYEETIEQYRV